MNITKSIRAVLGFGVNKLFPDADFEDLELAYRVMDRYFDGAFKKFAEAGIWYSFPEHLDAFLKAATPLFFGRSEKGLRSIQNVLQCDESPRACGEPICPYCKLIAEGKMTSDPRPQLHLAIDPAILLKAMQAELHE